MSWRAWEGHAGRGCVLVGKDSLYGEDVLFRAEVFSDFFFLFMQILTLIWEFLG